MKCGAASSPCMRCESIAKRPAGSHPGIVWIFQSDVVDTGGAEPGAAVRVADLKGRPIGMAHFSAASQISLRMLSRGVEEIGRDFFARRLAAAEAHRRRVVCGTDAYRVVHGEGDLLPALVVDRYADYLVLQTLNQGMDGAREWIVGRLVDLFSPRGIVARNDASVRAREALPLESGVIFGEVPDTVEFQMNGLRLHADLLHGQKTGIFLDQRENYVAAARYARGKALDCFTFDGRFRATPCPGLRIRGSPGQLGDGPGRGCPQRGLQRHFQYRIPRGRCIRGAGGIRFRAAAVSDRDPGSAGLRQVAQPSGGCHSRVQGD